MTGGRFAPCNRCQERPRPLGTQSSGSIASSGSQRACANEGFPWLAREAAPLVLGKVVRMCHQEGQNCGRVQQSLCVRFVRVRLPCKRQQTPHEIGALGQCSKFRALGRGRFCAGPLHLLFGFQRFLTQSCCLDFTIWASLGFLLASYDCHVQDDRSTVLNSDKFLKLEHWTCLDVQPSRSQFS